MDAIAIYYAIGDTFTSDDGAWEDAPLDGVLVVVIRDGERTEIHSGRDYYALLGRDTPHASLVSTGDPQDILRQEAPCPRRPLLHIQKRLCLAAFAQ